MRDFSIDIFRGFTEMKLINANGERKNCRGIITRLTGEDGNFTSMPGKLGDVPRYVFTGWMEEPCAPGDLLDNGEESYRVLDMRVIRLNLRPDSVICIRAVLERRCGGSEGG